MTVLSVQLLPLEYKLPTVVIAGDKKARGADDGTAGTVAITEISYLRLLWQEIKKNRDVDDGTTGSVSTIVIPATCDCYSRR